MLGTRERAPLQNLGTKCLNSDTLGTKRIAFRCLSDVNRCKEALRASVLIVVYTREMVPDPAATQAVPGGLPGRDLLRAVLRDLIWPIQALRKGHLCPL